jgi:hypothetical protein
MLSESHSEFVQDVETEEQELYTPNGGDSVPPVRRCPPPLRESNEGTAPPPRGTQVLAQWFGLHLAAAILTVLVDLMVSGIDTASFELLLPLGVVIAGVLGYIVFQIQIHWYGDSRSSALIKGMIIGLLTAIPAPLSPLIAVPTGVIGLAKLMRRK